MKEKRTFYGWLLLLLVSTALLSTCSSPVELKNDAQNTGAKGELVISLTYEAAEGDETDLTALVYTVSGAGPAGGSFVHTTKNSSITVKTLAEGDWTVTVQARTGAGDLAATGSATANVAGNVSGALTVSVRTALPLGVNLAVSDAIKVAGSTEYKVGLGGIYKLQGSLTGAYQGELSYSWYVNGLPSATGASYVLDTTGKGLVGGKIRVDVVASGTDGTTAGSASATFAIAGLSLRYRGDGSKTGTPPVDQILYSPGNTVKIQPNSGNLALAGYEVSGWNTKPDGSGRRYAAGDLVVLGDSPLVLYPNWKLGIPAADPLDDPANGNLFIGGQYVHFDTSRLVRSTPSAPFATARTIYVTGAWAHVQIGTDPGRWSTSDGFYAPQDGITTMVKAMVENSPNCDQVLIAHSLGGLRATGYVNILSRLGFGDRIKGVIFIGSPTKGMPLAKGGTAEFDRRVDAFVDRLTGYYESLISDLGTMAKKLDNLDPAVDWANLDDSANEARKKKAELVSYRGTIYEIIAKLADVRAGILSDTLVSEVDPDGEYFQNYMGRSLTSPTGFSAVIPSAAKVGFVVGIDSDPLDMLDPAGVTFEGQTLLPSQIKDEIKKKATEVGNTSTVLALAGWGLDIASVVMFLDPRYEEAADAVNNASDSLDDVSSFLHNYVEESVKFLSAGTYVEGTSRTDGFIPTRSQSRTIEEIGGRPIDTVYARTVFATHGDKANPLIGELTSPSIWGSSGSKWTSPIVLAGANSGILASYFAAAISDPSLSDHDKAAWQEASSNAFRSIYGSYTF